MDSCDPGRVCSLSPDSRIERAEAWKRLNAESLERRRLAEDRLRLTYRRDEGTAGRLERLVELEEACCGAAGMRFALSTRTASLVLDVTVPADLRGREEVLEIFRDFAAR